MLHSSRNLSLLVVRQLTNKAAPSNDLSFGLAAAGLRWISGSSEMSHVQPVLNVERDESVTAEQQSPRSEKQGDPRWLKELGVVRTDWTYVAVTRFLFYSLCFGNSCLYLLFSILFQCFLNDKDVFWDVSCAIVQAKFVSATFVSIITNTMI